MRGEEEGVPWLGLLHMGSVHTSARMKPLNTHHVGLADTSLIQQITTASNVAWIVAGGAGTPGVFDKRGGMQGKEREGRNNKEGKDRGKAN